jgi:hypothetical protein
VEIVRSELEMVSIAWARLCWLILLAKEQGLIIEGYW